MADIKILAEFDSVMDIDLALMMILQKDYNNPKYIDQNIMKLKLEDLKKKLVTRTHECPFSICIKNTEDFMNIYNELLKNRYDDILNVAQPTGVYKLMKIYSITKGYDIHILCTKNEEAEIINKLSPNIHPIVTSYDKINTDDYDVYFLKTITRVFKFNKKFESKYIFVMKYMYNLTKDKDGTLFPNAAIGSTLIPSNRIGLVDVYPNK